MVHNYAYLHFSFLPNWLHHLHAYIINTEFKIAFADIELWNVSACEININV